VNATAAPEKRRWEAPYAEAPLDAVVRVPGSKSMTARALILAALASGPSTIKRPLIARDTLLMVEGLRAIGVAVDTADDDTWTVTPASSRAGPPWTAASPGP
jgi:3-phosphoshikimate 1-carboxyvinyltransferase